jgi:putative ABC transport system permease protein
MAAFAFGLSLVAGLLAGVYPAWRVCRIPPAVHLKLQ